MEINPSARDALPPPADASMTGTSVCRPPSERLRPSARAIHRVPRPFTRRGLRRRSGRRTDDFGRAGPATTPPARRGVGDGAGPARRRPHNSCMRALSAAGPWAPISLKRDSMAPTVRPNSSLISSAVALRAQRSASCCSSSSVHGVWERRWVLRSSSWVGPVRVTGVRGAVGAGAGVGLGVVRVRVGRACTQGPGRCGRTPLPVGRGRAPDGSGC